MHKKIDSQLRIGESKHKAKLAYREFCERNNKSWNPAFAPGIYSIQTAENYRQTVNEFTAWLKSKKPEVWDTKLTKNLTFFFADPIFYCF